MARVYRKKTDWMGNRFRDLTLDVCAHKAVRTKDRKADLNGIWQTLDEADWDIRPHSRNFPNLPR